MSDETHIISMSGGKDSTATALLAIERGVEALQFVFADTGHEHPQTYEYVQYLDEVFRERCGVGITWVRADFTDKMRYRREHLAERWRKAGVPGERIEQARAMIEPTGVPFLDLCLLRGRFPSTRARFCSQELKHFPITEQVMVPATREHDEVWSWQGVRADESPSRARLPEQEPDPMGWMIYRPILAWTAQDVFRQHRRHGVAWNPLYEQGMSRVGCMPCIHAGKSELREIAKRYPEEVERVARWERMVADASKRGISSFFASDKTPGDHVGRADQAAPGIEAVMEWALTGRGGRQFDLLHVADAEEAPACSSVYGLCE